MTRTIIISSPQTRSIGCGLDLAIQAERKSRLFRWICQSNETICRALVIYFCMFIFLFATGCAVNPVTGKKQFTLISEPQEIAIGEEQYPIATQVSGGLLQDKALQAYVNNVGQKLAKTSHRPDLKYEFNVVNSSAVNAYALPGGKISITRGLLSRMENEAQLAGVLGHEIGHVTARHVSNALTRQLTAQLALATFSAYLEAKEIKHREYYSFAGLMATQLTLLKFSRDQESQSDELGIEYMSKLGYNTEGFVQMLGILQSAASREPSKVEGWLSSHPLTKNRINGARTRIAQRGATGSNTTFNMEEFQRGTQILQKIAPAYQHYDQAEKLMAKKNTQQAIVEYRKAIDLTSDQALFYSDLAFAYFKINNLREARVNIDRALQLYPGLFQSRFYSGLIALQTPDYSRALTDFGRADKLIPNQPSVIFYQGMCYEKLTNKDMAVKKYQQVLKLTSEGEYAQKAQERLTALEAANAAQ